MVYICEAFDHYENVMKHIYAIFKRIKMVNFTKKKKKKNFQISVLQSNKVASER